MHYVVDNCICNIIHVLEFFFVEENLGEMTECMTKAK